MGERRLIINADDFGLSHGVSQGIEEAIKTGIVTSTSVLVNMPSWEETAARLPALESHASIGLHLNLVAGKPLTESPSLSNPSTGTFASLQELVWRAARGRLRRREITEECQAQLARLVDTGVSVTHADSHRHVHMLPIVWQSIMPVLGGIPLRRSSERRVGHLGYRGALGSLTKRLALGASDLVIGDPAPRGADYFVGLALQGSERFERDLERALARLGVGTTELMVHPGYVDPALHSLDSYLLPRERELRALTSGAAREWLERFGIRLVRFRESRSHAAA